MRNWSGRGDSNPWRPAWKVSGSSRCGRLNAQQSESRPVIHSSIRPNLKPSTGSLGVQRRQLFLMIQTLDLCSPVYPHPTASCLYRFPCLHDFHPACQQLVSNSSTTFESLPLSKSPLFRPITVFMLKPISSWHCQGKPPCAHTTAFSAPVISRLLADYSQILDSTSSPSRSNPWHSQTNQSLFQCRPQSYQD